MFVSSKSLTAARVLGLRNPGRAIRGGLVNGCNQTTGDRCGIALPSRTTSTFSITVNRHRSPVPISSAGTQMLAAIFFTPPCGILILYPGARALLMRSRASVATAPAAATVMASQRLPSLASLRRAAIKDSTSLCAAILRQPNIDTFFYMSLLLCLCSSTGPHLCLQPSVTSKTSNLPPLTFLISNDTVFKYGYIYLLVSPP